MKKLTILIIALALGFTSASIAQTSTFVANADTAQEVPTPTINPSAPAPTATLNASYDGATGMITVSGSFSLQTAFAGAPGAHLHLGAPGMTGGVIVNLTPGVTVDASGMTGTFSGTYTVPAANESDLLAGNLYLNVHSVGNPSGEVRGQLELIGVQPVPTMGEWGLMILGLSILIFGLVTIKQRRLTFATK